MSDKGSQKDGTKTPRSQTASQRSRTSPRGSKTEPKTPRGRHNKIYRTPPTPDPTALLEKEKGFVLDSGAVSSISNDYSKANPKLGPVLPPYNSQKDKHSEPYFSFDGVDKTLNKTEQVRLSLKRY